MWRTTQGQRKRSGLAVFLVLLGVSCFARAGDDQPLAKVAFLTHWIPQAQFAGFFMAEARNLYREHGIDVTITDGGPSKSPGDMLASGQAMIISHFLSSALQLRDQGVPLVNLAQIGQRSALVLVGRRDKGIRTVQDLNGRKASVWPAFAVQPLALFKKYNLNVSILNQGATVDLFLRGGVDAASAMWYNEYHLILNSGFEERNLTLIFYDEHGLNFPEDGLYCLEDAWKKQPDVCRRFVEASIEGWTYAFAHEEETLKCVMERADRARTGTNRPHQRWMLHRTRDVTRPPDGLRGMGELSKDAYQNVVNELLAGGVIRKAPTFEEFYVAAHRKSP